MTHSFPNSTHASLRLFGSIFGGVNRRSTWKADAVVIATDHTEIDYAWIVNHSALVIDTRNATRKVKTGREKIVHA